MTSNEEQSAHESSQQRSDAAEKLVVDGYRRINTYFKAYLGNSDYTDGKILKEVFHKLSSVPHLLGSEDYAKFRRLTGSFGSEAMLGVITSILQDACGEQRLKPAIANDEKGKAVIILY